MASLMRCKAHQARKGEARKESEYTLPIDLLRRHKRKGNCWSAPQNLSAGQYIVSVQPAQIADSSSHRQ